jgi:hypothetical protein
VKEAGGNVTEFRAGDEVFGSCRGAFAEYVCTRESALAVKPAMEINYARLIRQPSAILPVMRSLAALAMVPGYIAMCGAARGADEGTTARIFQLLMAALVTIVAFFAIRWLPRFPRQALRVPALQNRSHLE